MRGAAKRQFRDALEAMAIPAPFSLESFCEVVGDQRGKPVFVRAVPCRAPGWLGAWVSSPEAEYIYHAAGLAGLRRDHAVLHHVGHMLLGHRARSVASLASLIAPGVSPRLVALLFGEDGGADAGAPYADEEEAAAEAIASLVLAAASRTPVAAWPAACWVVTE
jgi:hypothetical protein